MQLMSKYFNLQASFGSFINIYTKELLFVLFFASNFQSLRAQPCWFALYEYKAGRHWPY